MTISLNSVSSGYNLSTINSNWSILENYINTQLLHRRGNVVDEGRMNRNLDMNSFTILNAKVNGVFLDDLIQMIKDIYELHKELEEMMNQLLAMGGFNIGVQVAGFAALRLLNPTVDKQAFYMSGYYANSLYGGGMFYYDATDTTTPDDGGLVAVTGSGKRIKRFIPSGGVTFDDFGADPTFLTDSTAAVQRAYNAMGASKVKRIVAPAGAKYMLTGTIEVPRGVTTVGPRQGLNQGAGTMQDVPDRINVEWGAAFVWKGAENITMLHVAGNCSFKGLTFAYPDQDYTATTEAGLKLFGPCIDAYERSLSVESCIYHGMVDFVRAKGECAFFADNYGFAMGTAYYVYDSADINRFTNCHNNPNVIRPPIPFVNIAGNRDSAFIRLERHDETWIEQCFSIATRTFVKTSGTGRLNGVNINNCMADRTGTLLDVDTGSSSQVAISNTFYIHDYASSGADAGGLIFRKTTPTTNIFQVKISNCNFAYANGPFGLQAPQLMNFQTNSGFFIDTQNLSVPSLLRPTTSDSAELNNDAGFNVLKGQVWVGGRVQDLNSKLVNHVTNPAMAERPFSGSTPAGWGIVNATVTANTNSVISSGAGNDAYVSNTLYRTFTTTRTIIAFASAVGNSEGLVVVSSDADGSNAVTSTATWSRWGNRYRARIVLSTTKDIHEMRIMCGTSGNRVIVDYLLLANGDITDFTPDMAETTLAAQTGSYRWTALIGAGATYTLPQAISQTRGVMSIYLSSSAGMGHYQLIKNANGTAGVVTVVATQLGAGVTFTVAWPANSRPTITTNTATTFTITTVSQ